MRQYNIFRSVFEWFLLTNVVLISMGPVGSSLVVKAEKPEGLKRPRYEQFGKAKAEKFDRIGEARPKVYSRLAEYLVDKFELSKKKGIGIDLGGGPGDFVFELVKRTEDYYWINADINTWCAEAFATEALKKGFTHQTSFIFADACWLPFTDNYADVIVSRGSYQFWNDLEKGLTEILRVLRDGGKAFIGRGVAPTMPESEVRRLTEAGLIGGPPYDPDKHAERFRRLIKNINVDDYEVIRHKPKDSELNYGVWLYFRK